MLAALAIAPLSNSLTVWEPASLHGDYSAVGCEFAPEEYSVTALGAVARTCPCEWTMQSIGRTEGLQGQILVIPDGLCPSSCSAKSAACAAKLANASGALLTHASEDEPQPGMQLRGSYDGQEFVAFDVAYNASCDEDPLPAAYITVNTSDLLVHAALEDPTDLADVLANDSLGDIIQLGLLNLTMRSGDVEDDEYNCDKYTYMPLVYLLLVPVWWLLTVMWTWNTYRAHASSARDLHRLLCWVPIMQFVHGILSLFNYSSCPWDTTLSLVYATFWAVVTILKEPVVLLCLLLVAKGWCITRNTLQRREVCFAGCNLALLYAAVSVQLSVQSLLSTVPMILMYLAMLCDISLSIFANLRILKAQLLALRSFGIDPRTTPAHRKYEMFVRLAKYTALYVLLELLIHMSFSGRGEEQFWLFVLLHQLMELGIACGIGYTFRAQPFNVLFQQVQQVASELADQLLPSITTVEIKPDLLNGADLIAWRSDLTLGPGLETHMPTTLVVLNPGDKEMPPASTTPTRAVPSCVTLPTPPEPPPLEPPPAAAATTARSPSRGAALAGRLSGRLSGRAGRRSGSMPDGPPPSSTAEGSPAVTSTTLSGADGAGEPLPADVELGEATAMAAAALAAAESEAMAEHAPPPPDGAGRPASSGGSSGEATADAAPDSGAAAASGSAPAAEAASAEPCVDDAAERPS